MKLRKLFFVTALMIAGLIMVWHWNSRSDKQTTPPYVVILSLDGFRYDFQGLAYTPTLDSLEKYGTKAEAFIPCFPSKTFPNHYSMATGLHPDNHGIVDNRFWDSVLGMYSIGRRKAVENGDFYGGEPFWQTAEKHGIKSATFFWVGSEAPINGQHPSYWKTYQEDIPFENRIDTVIYWLSLPEAERPRVVALYYHEPDKMIHRLGATHDSVLQLITWLDSMTGVLLKRLNELPVAQNLHFVLVSDHGMTDIWPEKYINLAEYVDTSMVALVTGGSPVINLSTVKGFEDTVLQQLQRIPNISAWHRTQVPERLHYGKNPRILPIVVAAAPGYNVGIGEKAGDYTGATHGYDNQFHEMWGIFYAIGPTIKKNYKHQAMLNLNLYNVVVKILEIEPAANDGNPDEIKDIFRRRIKL